MFAGFMLFLSVILHSVVNIYLNHLKFCVVCINGRRNVCCSECYVLSDECDEPTTCLVRSIGAHGGEVMYFWSLAFGMSLST